MSNKPTVHFEYCENTADRRTGLIFENGDSEWLMLAEVGGGLYRLEESSFAGDAMYGDTIHADATPNGDLIFRGFAERSALKSQSWVLSAELIESEPINAILANVTAAGGMWERAFGGVLLIHTPPAMADAISERIRAANPKSEGRRL
jgi:hypothetical protein